MSFDWKGFYQFESSEELKYKLVFSQSDYEKGKIEEELARREAEEAFLTKGGGPQ